MLSAGLRSVRPGRHGSEAVTRHPVMPVANGLAADWSGSMATSCARETAIVRPCQHVPTTLPSLARSLLTVPSPKLVIQTLLPSKAVATGETPSVNVPRFLPSERACNEAGLPVLHFHDLRQTAVRNMGRRHVSEKVAMEVGGRKATSVFHPYAIVDNQDVADAIGNAGKKPGSATVKIERRAYCNG